MYKTKNLGLNITEMPQDTNAAFSFAVDLGDNFNAIDAMTLSHRNITNCLLEVPQDIKYTLENGNLTIKSGSIVYVPYGTEDKTAQFPVGSTFLNDTFKVVNTQYTNGKFFVWAEFTNDCEYSRTTNDNAERLWYVIINDFEGRNHHEAALRSYSISAVTTEDGYIYNTETNFIDYYDTGVPRGYIGSFPIGKVIADKINVFSAVSQVFNGMGYIGSTVFALPGVKGLIPNGRNEDESLKNIAFTLDKVLVNNGGAFSSKYFLNSNAIEPAFYANYAEQAEKPSFVNGVWFNTKENQMYRVAESVLGAKWNYAVCIDIIADTDTSSVVSFMPKKPFRAVDYNDYQSKITELETKIQALQTAIEALQV
jgi:hypothetical protein